MPDDPCPHLSDEEGRSGSRHDDAEDQVDPSPRGVVDVHGEPVLADQVVLVPEQRHQSLDGVEDAQHHHHGGREHDPTDPAGLLRLPAVARTRRCGLRPVRRRACARVRHDELLFNRSDEGTSLVRRPDAVLIPSG